VALPVGVDCPQCASPTKGAPRQLRLVQNGEEPSTKYVNSPRTQAEMDRIHRTQSGSAGAKGKGNSPLKVGDDHNALSRKMLPFRDIVVEEPPGAADESPGDGAPQLDAAGVLPAAQQDASPMPENAAPDSPPVPSSADMPDSGVDPTTSTPSDIAAASGDGLGGETNEPVTAGGSPDATPPEATVDEAGAKAADPA